MKEAGEKQKGAMAALKTSMQEAQTLCNEVLDEAGLKSGLVIANDNKPEQIVISGTEELIIAALIKARLKKITGKKLPVSIAAHSPLMQSAKDDFAAFLEKEKIEFKSTKRTYYSKRNSEAKY